MTTQTLTFRPAEPDDLDTVDGLRVEATEWLASKGLDQWQPDQARFPTRAGIAAAIARRVCYLAYDQHGTLVGTITVDGRADPEFWTQAEQDEPALYIHRMIVSRQAAGAGLGGRLLDWAADVARRTGRHWVRLDAWKNNPALRRYYERHGFEHVRTVDLPHRGSGTLLQRAALPHDRDALNHNRGSQTGRRHDGL
jgi:ribosomal protein S18 acetylase RimI-like enzyme